MACALTTDYVLDCQDSLGGLQELYLMEIGNVSSITVSSGNVTAIVKASGKQFRKYELVLNTAHAESEQTSDRANGTRFYKQTLEIVINKLQNSMIQELQLLSQNRLVAVVKDRNGTYFYLGYVNGLMVSKTTSMTGTASGDRNGHTITLEGEEPNDFYTVSSNIISGLQTAE